MFALKAISLQFGLVRFLFLLLVGLFLLAYAVNFVGFGALPGFGNGVFAI